MFGLKTPDITQAQIAAAAAWVVGQLVAMGVVDNDTAQWMLQASVSFIAFGWILGDAIIRQGRAKAAGLAAQAGTSSAPRPPALTSTERT